MIFYNFDFQKSIQSGEQPTDRIVKEKLAAAKAAWSEAARSNPDSLNIDEFLVGFLSHFILKIVSN